MGEKGWEVGEKKVVEIKKKGENCCYKVGDWRLMWKMGERGGTWLPPVRPLFIGHCYSNNILVAI